MLRPQESREGLLGHHNVCSVTERDLQGWVQSGEVTQLLVLPSEGGRRQGHVASIQVGLPEGLGTASADLEHWWKSAHLEAWVPPRKKVVQESLLRHQRACSFTDRHQEEEEIMSSWKYIRKTISESKCTGPEKLHPPHVVSEFRRILSLAERYTKPVCKDCERWLFFLIHTAQQGQRNDMCDTGRNGKTGCNQRSKT